MVIGDIAGDTIIYYVGYFGKKFTRYFKINDEKLEKAKQYFKDNHNKAIVMSKLLHGIGFTGLIAAGISHVPYHKYVKTSTFISVIQTFVMLMIGILFGHAYVQIGKYLNYYAATISLIVLIVIMVILIKKYRLSAKP